MILHTPYNMVMNRRSLLAATVATLLAGALPVAIAIDLDVPYVETPDDIVTLMLDLAEITDNDYVIDLGTGDGRIVIGAVKRGATGLGVDLDPVRIDEARVNADKAGVSDRVKFEVGDLFQTDISAATVITLFLNSEVNMRLRPALFVKLKPGTRVVSHNFDMEDWQPDRQEQLMLNANNNFYIHDIFYWVIPADVSGVWGNTDESFYMSVVQQFQKIKPEIKITQQPLIITEAELSGTEIRVNGTSMDGSNLYNFSGHIIGNQITGTIKIGNTTSTVNSDWSVSRKSL